MKRSVKVETATDISRESSLNSQNTSEELPNMGPKSYFIALLVAGVILFFILDLLLGSVHIPISDVLQIVFTGNHDNEAWIKILEKIRIPKAFTAILAGAALSLGGLQMQTLFRNPLAGPSVLGITAGASLGVAVVMLASGAGTTFFAIKQLGISGSWLIVVAASAGAALVLLIVLAIAVRINDHVVLLIVGIMVGNITLSLVSVWQYFSQPEEIQEYLIWTFGSLGGVTNQHLQVLAWVVTAGVIMAFLASKSLNMLLLGENYARSLGLKPKTTRTLIIFGTSLLAGGVTGFCGPIGFVGIAVPHLTRSLLNTSDHRILVPTTCLMGAVLMLGCDIIAQLPGSTSTLPINAVTALIGSPVVIWVIVKNRNLKASF